jgi:hypothetical protein
MSSSAKPMNNKQKQDSLETRLQALLDEYHRTRSPDTEDKIVAELIPYFHEFLRGYVATSLHPSIVNQKRDQSLGFTALLNEAYLKLKKTSSLN